MATAVTLPKLGESVMEGTITRWLKEEGQWVDEDEMLFEISTDKIDTEIPSPAAGVLQKILVQVDETVNVGTEVALIDESGAKADGKAGAKGDGKAGAKGDGKAGTQAPAREEEPEETEAQPKQEPKDEEQKQPAGAEPDARAKDEAVETPEAAETKPEKKAAADREQGSATEEQMEAVRAAQSARAQGTTGTGARTFHSPLVRKLARERGVDLSQVRGTGTDGRITKDDVLAASERGPAAAPGRAPAARAPEAPRPAVPAAVAQATSRYEVPAQPTQDVSFDRVRKAIAEHMSRSRRTAADVTNVIEVDMTRIVHLREAAKDAFRRSEGFNLTYMPFIAAAVVQALRQFPEFNAHILEDGTTARLFRQVNLGIAVGRDEGLIVPVVHGADGMNLIGLARAINDIGTRARTKGALKPDDVTGGTFTLTNYGSFGGVVDTPIIAQPQAAILGIGAIVKRPAVIEVDGADAIAIRHMLFLSLSYDHRWIDGHKAAQFNGRLKQILEAGDLGSDLGIPAQTG